MNKQDIRNKIKIGNADESISISDNLINDIVRFECSNGISLSKMFPEKNEYKESSAVKAVIEQFEAKGAKKIIASFFYTEEPDKLKIFEELLSAIKNSDNDNQFDLQNAHQLAFILCLYKENGNEIKVNGETYKLKNFYVTTYERDENNAYKKYELNYNEYYFEFINFVHQGSIFHRKYNEIKKLLKFDTSNVFIVNNTEILKSPYFKDNGEFVCHHLDNKLKNYQTNLINFIYSIYKDNNSIQPFLINIDFNDILDFDFKKYVYPNTLAYQLTEIDENGIEKIKISEVIPNRLINWISSNENKLKFLFHCGLNTEISNLVILRSNLLNPTVEITDTIIAHVGDLLPNKQFLKNTLFWLKEQPYSIKDKIISILERIYKIFDTKNIDCPILTISSFESNSYIYSLNILSKDDIVYFDIDEVNEKIRKKVIELVNPNKIVYNFHKNLFSEIKNIGSQIFSLPNVDENLKSGNVPEYILQFNKEQISNEKKIVLCKTQIPLNQYIFKSNSKLIRENYYQKDIAYNSDFIFVYEKIDIEKEFEQLEYINKNKFDRLKTLKKIFALKSYLINENETQIFATCQIEYDTTKVYKLEDFDLAKETDFFIFEGNQNLLNLKFKNSDKRLLNINQIYSKIKSENIQYALFIDSISASEIEYSIKDINNFSEVFHGLDISNKDFSEYNLKIWKEVSEWNMSNENKKGFVCSFSIPTKSKEISIIRNDFDLEETLKVIVEIDIISKSDYEITNYQSIEDNNSIINSLDINSSLLINYIEGEIPKKDTFLNFTLNKYNEGFFYQDIISKFIYVSIEKKHRILDILLDNKIITLDEYTKLSKDPNAVYNKIKEEKGFTDEQMALYLSKIAKMSDEELNSEDEENSDEDQEDNKEENKSHRQGNSVKNQSSNSTNNKQSSNANFENTGKNNSHKSDTTYTNFETGENGEKYVYEQLTKQFSTDKYNVIWNNKGSDGHYNDKKEPWDIEIFDTMRNETILYIDVKTTVTKEEDADRISFFITGTEWKFLKGELQKYGSDIIEKYCIARVFDINGSPIIRYLKLECFEIKNYINE